jgi:ankyrin repeat protein
MPSSITKALSEFPITLDDTYERALEGIAKKNRYLAQRLFQCLVVAVRPLSVEELAEVFAIQFDSDAGPTLKEDWRTENPGEVLLSTCSTLITIIDNMGSSSVQFSHFSVKQFLTSHRLRYTTIDAISTYYVPTNPAHAVLAQACLTVLLQLDENVDKRRLASLPLVLYAARHWIDHARSEEVELLIQDLMKRLFDPKRPHLGAWIWIYDVDSDIKRPINKFDGYPSPPGATPLYYAASCGLSWLVRYLITSCAEDVNAKSGRYGTPLHAASHKGQVAAARVLLKYVGDTNVTNRYRKSPLFTAYLGKHTEVMELLLQHGANFELPFDHNGTILHRASADGRSEVVWLLLRHRARVNAQGGMQWTPLHFAASYGHLEVARLLIECKANVNAQVRDHGTPLHLASQRGHVDVVQLLLNTGADVHIRRGDNKTALERANAFRHSVVARLLLEHGAQSE